eukprot:6271965-Heterocapsa_arctica.AAC.1
MLKLFCENYHHWREALQDYLGMGPGEVKVALIKLFYGAKPATDIPFLRKLCSEVQSAAKDIVRHPSCSRFAK